MKIENCKIENSPSIFAFVLGREQKIALAELESVLRRFCFDFSILSVLDNVAIIKIENSTESMPQPAELIDQLGGTIKIYQIIQNSKLKTHNFGAETLIVNELNKNTKSGTLNFGISDYSGQYSSKKINEMGIQIKIKARKKRPVRFVAGHEVELSSATSYHKIYKTKGEEYGIFLVNKIISELVNLGEPINQLTNQPINQQLIGKLIAVSNPDEWSKRDYGKPAGDKYSGMMPPKLARAMVNIALSQAISNDQLSISKQYPNSKFKIENLNDSIIFDPFCGSGNILMEASLLGCDIMGSDISEKAVEDTRANLEWLNNELRIMNNGGDDKDSKNHNSLFMIHNSVFQADATTFDFASRLSTFDFDLSTHDVVVVTEPYLGKPKQAKVVREKAKEEIEELKKLYFAFFRNAKKLTLNSYNLLTICFVFPLIETTDGGTISLYDECVDELRQIGYNPIQTFIYGRDYQVTKRQIALLSQRITK